MSFNADLAIKAMAHANGMGNSDDTEFEIRKGIQEWNKMSETQNTMSDLIIEGQIKEGRYGKEE